jgi:uncharacterized protein with PQ loop repeat
VLFHPLIDALGWVAVVFSVLATVVQFRRIRRLGPDGVSIATWTLFALMGVFWTAYGVEQHSAVIVMGSLPLLPIQAALLARLSPRREWRVLGRSVVSAVLFCLVPTLAWGWNGGVFGTGLLMVFNRGPQIIELVRAREALGVSTATWLLGFTGSVLWVLYYVGQRLWAPSLATGFAGLASLSIAGLAAWRHAQADEPVVVGDVALA